MGHQVHMYCTAWYCTAWYCSKLANQMVVGPPPVLPTNGRAKHTLDNSSQLQILTHLVMPSHTS